MAYSRIRSMKSIVLSDFLGADFTSSEGEVDAKAFVAELKRLGYQGCFVIEREGGVCRAKDIARAVERLK